MFGFSCRLLAVCAFCMLGWYPVSAGPNKLVRDWQVYCENSLACTANLYNSPTGLYSFGFERGPTADAPLTFFLSIQSRLNEESDIQFKIPGELEEFYLSVREGEFKESVWRFTNAEIASQLLPAMLRGKEMTLNLETADGFFNPAISLSGVTAAMLFIDDVQQRVGNRDALVKPGNGEPRDAATNVSDLKSTADLPESVASLWRQNTNFCAENEEDLIQKFGGFQVELKGAVLYLLPCGFPGAYSLPHVSYVLIPETKKARQLLFPVMGAEGPTIMEQPINPNWDHRKNQLEARAKGRGLGDCGVSHIWRFVGEAEYGNFELVEERRKDNCDGVYDEWPLVWPIP